MTDDAEPDTVAPDDDLLSLEEVILPESDVRESLDDSPVVGTPPAAEMAADGLTPVDLVAPGEELPTAGPFSVTAEARAHGWRIDHYMARVFPAFSRSLFQKTIDAGKIRINGLEVRSARRLRVNDRVSGALPEAPDTAIPAEPIPLTIVYEDEWFCVIDKPHGLVVHPGRGNASGTLVNALQYHLNSLSDVAGRHRPGIVHRLDRDTTGLLVVAKDNAMHAELSAQFEQRTVSKQYHAIVWGQIEFDSDYIETHIKVSSRNRERMQVCGPEPDAREAITFYEVIERYPRCTYVRLHPKTGRTHQLRVHMQYLGHPLVADRQYGGRPVVTWEDLGLVRPIDAPANLMHRQALHAHRLEFNHPRTGQRVSFEAPVPPDMCLLLGALEQTRGGSR